MYPKIEKCPFCGGIGKLEQKSKTYIHHELKYVTYVRCIDCDARGRRMLIEDDPQLSRRIAILNWNRRA